MSEFEVLETIRCKDCRVETAFVSVEGEVLTYEEVEHSKNCVVNNMTHELSTDDKGRLKTINKSWPYSDMFIKPIDEILGALGFYKGNDEASKLVKVNITAELVWEDD